jgi:hypothetical protein
VEEAWHEQGVGGGGSLPTGERRPAGSGPKPVGARNVRALPAEQRGREEADGWATTTVSGGGAADERGPSSSERGREERGTDRRDRPVSGHGRQGGCGLHGACVSRPGKEKKWAEPR